MIQNKIRRKERAVTDLQQMLDIMRQCDVCRIGFQDQDGVYIVPLNFAFEATDNELILYFHGHMKGKKMDLAQHQPIVGFEMDRKHELVKADIACMYSYRYQSIIGKGKISIVETQEAKAAALQVLMKHYTGKDNWIFDEIELRRVNVLKLVVTEWACKEH